MAFNKSTQEIITETTCPFCNLEISNDIILPDNLRSKAITNQEQKIFINRRYTIVISDIAPIVPHHLLIIPKRHSFSKFLLNNDEEAEISDIMSEIEIFNESALNFKTIFFEHGTCHDGGSSCIKHCHIHALGIDQGTYERVTKEIYRRGGEEDQIERHENYLMFAEHANKRICWLDDKGETQWFRKLITQEIQQPDRGSWKYCLSDFTELERTISYIKEASLLYSNLSKDQGTIQSYPDFSHRLI